MNTQTTNTKKILIITDNLVDQVNGVVTTFKNLELEAAKDGYTVEYIDPSYFSHFSAPGYPEVKISWPKNIGQLILEKNATFIHIATEGPIGLASRIWMDRNHLRYNTSYHTKFPEFLKIMYGIPEWLTYAYVKWFHKHSGKVLTTTTTMVDDLRKHGFAGDIIAWTRGVDRSIFKSSLRRTSGKTGILLNVGRVSDEKNLEEFCRMQIPGYRKIIVGDGPAKHRLEQQFPDVDFVGVKKGTELAEYYANADVFVFPSKTDTFGIVIIESLAVGTPVAGYPVPGPVDILEQNVTGVMNENLQTAVEQCLELDRKLVESNSVKWSWDHCWKIFKENLICS